MEVIIAFLGAAVIASPCEIDGVKADCGKLKVPENRSIEGGRTIELHYAVLPATPKQKTKGALLGLAGGPGQSATAMAGFLQRLFGGAGRDIVVVDVRGTGRSNPLHCDFGGGPGALQGYFNDMLPVDRVERCRKTLEKKAELTQYTTTAIAQDLEEVRKHLGYDTFMLYGTSYGTRVALEMMRPRLRNLRLVILDGVVPPSLASPATFAPDAQRSLEAVFAMCVADEACRNAYPALPLDFATVLAAAAKDLQITVVDPKTKKPTPVKINRGFFGEILRNFLYSSDLYVQLPHAIHTAAKGDWKSFGEMAVRYAVGIRSLDFGLFLSVTCTEDIPRLDVAAATEAAKDTFLGTYRIDQQVAACSKWEQGVLDEKFSRPVVSKVPTLIVSGELDPVTPPRFGDEVAKTLSATHVVIPKGSHSGDTGGCLEKILHETVKGGSGSAADKSCVAGIARPPFVVQ